MKLFAIALMAACAGLAQTGSAMKLGCTTFHDVGVVTATATTLGNTKSSQLQAANDAPSPGNWMDRRNGTGKERS
jgi:hypothetical protein